ncbi:Curli production assembly/transport component CsgG subfamily protein [[Synechococcus] sp. NIES-970]|uniref:CsgG/HfaB family protein n=1 Tax=Picosynechococcus sp. NKBG15041c TaxID=1407650 RepID=UPI000403CC8F|nr:CsgG/HfaB family protein [Picosynechococcus sp. NKBG15041c]BAW95693.1 Curli production assembly/transport component CsgG subfamily protein [[Synechococcus] sp. NIES-970]
MKANQFLTSMGRSTTLAVLALTLGLGSNEALAQVQPTISVPEFKNETSGSNWWWWNNSVSQELADALSNELTATGNFRVVERQNLGAVLSEQELAELGIVRPETGAQRGQVTGAQYIVLGQVTSYEEGVQEESTGLGISGIRIGGFRIGGGGRGSSEEAYVAVDLRVVDSTTGEVVHARTVEGRATSTENSGGATASFAGINLGGDRTATNRAPVGQALRAALIEATDYLSCVMVEQDGCLATYQARDDRRRENTRSILDLD